MKASLHAHRIGAWAAVCQRGIIRPVFFEIYQYKYKVLNSRQVLTSFRGIKCWTLQNGNRNTLVNMLHDDELQQYRCKYWRFFFGACIISLYTRIIWPRHSCDLALCDFSLWSHLKYSIFGILFDLNHLQQKINIIEEISNMPWILKNVINSVKRKTLNYRDENTDHITHLV